MISSEVTPRSAAMWTRKTLALLQRQQKSIRLFSKTAFECQGKVLAIRREETSVWERRAPLNPNQVQTLVSDGVKVNQLGIFHLARLD